MKQACASRAMTTVTLPANSRSDCQPILRGSRSYRLLGEANSRTRPTSRRGAMDS